MTYQPGDRSNGYTFDGAEWKQDQDITSAPVDFPPPAAAPSRRKPLIIAIAIIVVIAIAAVIGVKAMTRPTGYHDLATLEFSVNMSAMEVAIENGAVHRSTTCMTTSDPDMFRCHVEWTLRGDPGETNIAVHVTPDGENWTSSAAG